MANEFKIKKGLIVTGSGGTVFDVQGSQGQLFSVTDSLTGVLFSVNDISGIPVFTVSSDDSLTMGTYGSEAIKINGSYITIGTEAIKVSGASVTIGNEAIKVSGSSVTILGYSPVLDNGGTYNITVANAISTGYASNAGDAMTFGGYGTSYFINTSNIGSQKVDGSFKLWSESHPNDFYLKNNWTGTYWQITSNHGSGVQVAYADSSGYANWAGDAMSFGGYGPSYYINTDNIGAQSVSQAYSLYDQYNGGYIQGNYNSYGSFLVSGTRNGYAGFEFNSLTNGNVSLMLNPTSNETGFYNTSYGWQTMWSAGTLYVFKNNYGGGTQATVLDSSNYTSYISSGGIGGSGTNLYIPRWNGSSSLTNSQLYDNGTNVGLNTTSMSGKFHVNGVVGSISIYASGDIVAYSDKSVKTNIRPIDNVLERVIKSRGIIYDRTDIKADDNIGFIAQELEVQFPELVSTSEDGTKAVKYQNATAVLFEAVKEQQKQINDLNDKINNILRLIEK